MAKRKKKKGKRLIFLLLFLLFGGCLFYFWERLFRGVSLHDKPYVYLYVGRNDDFEKLIGDLKSADIIEDESAFRWLARKMKLPENIHPGRYRILNGMSMRQIVNLIRYRKDEKVKLTINSQIRDLEDFIRYVDDKLELSDEELEDFIADESKLKKYFGLDEGSVFGLVMPGTYDLNWAISAEDFFDTLRGRFNRIWNQERRQKASLRGFSVPEVITIASIVQCESNISSEQQKIAGVYINRLRRNMLLQADPTLKFAGKNYDVRRLLNEDKDISSPYNTYKIKGLPPGPICPVSVQAIDATLNYRKHDFLYFCARPDLNGYSDFSSSYQEHCRYAKAYQRKLDRIGVSR
jgi:UPF0755 protein